jgi:hypothetical protein
MTAIINLTYPLIYAIFSLGVQTHTFTFKEEIADDRDP